MTIDAEPETLSLVRGDALFRLQRAVGLIPSSGLGLIRRALFYAALTWLPVAVWAFWRGRALAGALDETLLQHYGVHIRCLIAIPFLILAEGPAHGVGARLLPQFTRAGIVEDGAALRSVVHDVARLRDRTLPWIIIAGLVLAWTFLAPHTHQSHQVLWASEPSEQPGLGFGGWWYLYVARPIYVALVIGWLWRLVLLAVLLRRLSQLELSLVPTHPDRHGGLAFLARMPAAFVLVVMALSTVLASGWAHDVVYHQLDIRSLAAPAALFLALMLLLFLAPLLAFTPALHRARKAALLDYAALVARHGREVRTRWIERQPVEDKDGLLSAPEIGPVADTLSMYDAVTRMSSMAFDKASLLAVLVPAIIPMLVVVSIKVPIKTVVLSLLKALT